MTDDFLAIQRLTIDYCWYADTRDVAGIVSLFTDDCVFDATAFDIPVIRGHEALRELFQKLLPEHEYSQHLAGNHRIDISGDAARGTSYYAMRGRVRDGGGVISASGYYADVYTRTPAGWRIAERRGVPLLPPDYAPMTDSLG